MKHLKKIRGLQVLSFFNVCPCGEEVPYGQSTCKSHANWGKLTTEAGPNFLCSMCKKYTSSIEISRRKNGTIRECPRWLNSELGIVCGICYSRLYHKKNRERDLARCRKNNPIYYKNNADRIRKRMREYMRKRRLVIKQQKTQ